MSASRDQRRSEATDAPDATLVPMTGTGAGPRPDPTTFAPTDADPRHRLDHTGSASRPTDRSTDRSTDDTTAK